MVAYSEFAVQQHRKYRYANVYESCLSVSWDVIQLSLVSIYTMSKECRFDSIIKTYDIKIHIGTKMKYNSCNYPITILVPLIGHSCVGL